MRAKDQGIRIGGEYTGLTFGDVAALEAMKIILTATLRPDTPPKTFQAIAHDAFTMAIGMIDERDKFHK